MIINNIKVNRRQFLSKSLSTAATAGLFSSNTESFSLNKIVKNEKKIIYRKLGKTNIELPIVSMGIMNCFNDALVKRSFEIGVRHFDTSSVYQNGRNEEMLGKVIKELNARDKVIIGTKINIYEHMRTQSPKEIKETCLKIIDESLKRLQSDYVDILYSHNVFSLEWLNNPGILEALQIIKDQKKARLIGFSTHSNMSECINNAAKTGFYDVILTAYNYGMGDDESLTSAMKKAVSKGIGLIAMKTQCPHYFYRHMNDNKDSEFYKGRILHTAVLKWALKNNFITTAIPGYSNFEQMTEDFSVAYDLDYTIEEKKFLEDKQAKMSLGYCFQCGNCILSCPKGVEIPKLMRVHMYATCYANFFQARDVLNEIQKNKGLKTCLSCRSCQATCVNKIDISKRIKELLVIYG